MSAMQSFPTISVDHIIDNQKILGALHRVFIDDFPALLNDANINQHVSKTSSSPGMIDTRFTPAASH